MHIRDQRNSYNFYGYKKHITDHKLEVHRSQQTHAKELHHMDLQETIVLRIKRERGIHLDTNYGFEGLQPRNER